MRIVNISTYLCPNDLNRASKWGNIRIIEGLIYVRWYRQLIQNMCDARVDPLLKLINTNVCHNRHIQNYTHLQNKNRCDPTHKHLTTLFLNEEWNGTIAIDKSIMWIRVNKKWTLHYGTQQYATQKKFRWNMQIARYMHNKVVRFFRFAVNNVGSQFFG